MGLVNASGQASACVGLLFKMVIDAGYTIVDRFYVLAFMNLVAGVGIFFLIPSKQEFLAEAGRVVAVDSSGGDTSSLIGWWHFEYQMLEFRQMLTLFPWQTYGFVLYNGTMLGASIYLVSIAGVMYTLWYLASGPIDAANRFS